MKWLTSFLNWIFNRKPVDQPVVVENIPNANQVKIVEEKIKKSFISSSKEISDAIREGASAESFLAELRSLSASIKTAPHREEIVGELKKISDQTVQKKF